MFRPLNTLLFLITVFGTLLSGITSAQQQGNKQGQLRNQIPSRGFIFETVSIPSKSGQNLYISYKVEYNRLVFVRDEDKFISRFSVSVEAIDSVSGKIYRETQKKEVFVNNYELTNAPYKYVEGLIKLDLPSGKYRLLPSVYDINTGIEHNFPFVKVEPGILPSADLLEPLVVKDISKDGQMLFALANYEGNIPFSRDKYNLIIPVTDTSLRSVKVEIWNEDSLIIQKELTRSFISSIYLTQDGDNILLNDKKGGVQTRNFVIEEANRNLKEGGVRIKVSYGDNFGKKHTFIKYSKWYNKPFALFNTEYAVKMLKYIASENDIETVLSHSGQLLPMALFEFWKKYDPTPNTSFNEIMEEYYQRVDYAINNFSVIPTRNGAETDRGKIYIKFGKPKDIERTYADSKDVKEIWHYDTPGRQFVFVDKSGLGNFVLNMNL